MGRGQEGRWERKYFDGSNFPLDFELDVRVFRCHGGWEFIVITSPGETLRGQRKEIKILIRICAGS
jgi:hypothetical protein